MILFVESKYEIIMDRFELPLGEKDKIFKVHDFRVKKFNRTTAIFSGTVELKMALDNSFIASFEAYNLSGGKYQLRFGRSVGPFCDVLYEQHVESEVKNVITHTNSTTKYKDCPILAQVINFNDYIPDNLGDYLPNYLPGNERWKIDFWLSKNDVVLGGTTNYAIIRDEQKLFDSKW